jgi:hypothetical protein
MVGRMKVLAMGGTGVTGANTASTPELPLVQRGSRLDSSSPGYVTFVKMTENFSG